MCDPTIASCTWILFCLRPLFFILQPPVWQASLSPTSPSLFQWKKRQRISPDSFSTSSSSQLFFRFPFPNSTSRRLFFTSLSSSLYWFCSLLSLRVTKIPPSFQRLTLFSSFLLVYSLPGHRSYNLCSSSDSWHIFLQKQQNSLTKESCKCLVLSLFNPVLHTVFPRGAHDSQA